MDSYEKLGVFYLGKLFDPEKQAAGSELLLYEAKDLTTHAVCVGMTGSGKTGLCLALLEEAALDGIPAIAIDPKGDLGNLLLTFPELNPADFLPWIDLDEARRQGCPPDEFAARTAETWRRGLGEWGQSPERIARLRAAADIAIYTPGSNAGLPLTVLRGFAAPPPEVCADAEALRERVAAAVGGLLALLGIAADPVRSREHILLSNLLDRAWREGRSPDLGALIREIQSPPFDRIGVMDLESIFPAAARHELALQINNLLAAPGFAAWREGEPLDVQRLLYTAQGHPRLSILSIAHLSDSERMFFVTLLLNEVVTWMRAQPGTSSLRALLYMDEVFGYFPPTANPPSKTPMLTLLKQARAYGLGVVLATQNPVDLDYKGLANTGTWFLGRLQTERDKARVLDGLEGASASAGAAFDRSRMEKLLSALGSRVFLMNNVHEDAPVVFQSRWALSYLRGPLTRAQIEILMKDRRTAAPVTESAAPPAAAAPQAPPALAGGRPVIPPGIAERFLRPARAGQPGAKLVFRPALFGMGRVHYVQKDLDRWETIARLSTASDDSPDPVWLRAEAVESSLVEGQFEPPAEAAFAELPAAFARPKNYTAWRTALKNYLYEHCPLKLFACPSLKETSRPGESEGDFRVRLRQRVVELRDAQLEKLRQKYVPKQQRLEQRIRQAEQQIEREKSQVREQTLQTATSLGSTILGALFGRKLRSATNVTRAATSVRSAGRVAREQADVARAEENAAALRQQRLDLDAEFQAEVESLRDRYTVDQLEIAETPLRARKSDLVVEPVTLVWVPWYVDATGIAERAV